MENYEQYEPVNRKLSFYELLYGILFQPRVTFKNIAATTPLLHAFLIFLGVNVLTTLVSFFTVSGPGLNQSMGEGIPLEFQKFLEFFTSPAFATMGTFFALIFSLVMWFLLSAVLNLVAELFGGKGRGIGVLTVLGCATLPQIVVIPFQVLFYLIGLPSGLLALITIPLFIWAQLILPILGLREVHQFSLGKAVLTIFAPMVLFFGLIIMLLGAFITLMVPFLG